MSPEDLQICRQYLGSKRLDEGWLSYAWEGVEKARKKFDPQKGSWFSAVWTNIQCVISQRQRYELRSKRDRRLTVFADHETEHASYEFDRAMSQPATAEEALSALQPFEMAVNAMSALDNRMFAARIEGYSVAEIAAMEGCTKGYVSQRIAAMKLPGRPALNKICTICECSYEGSENSLYCSFKCRKRKENLKRKQHSEKTCPKCGTVFSGPPRTKYCTRTCQQRRANVY
jgi:RNA polymerase sigma factor (sigma-70 family)